MPTPYPFQSGATLLASQMNSLSQLPTVSITANSTAVATHAYSRVIANGSAITYTIPNSVFEAGQVIEFHNINSTACTIAAGSGVTLNGAAGLTVAQYQSARIYATSASSFILFESDVTVSSGGLVYLTGASFTTATSFSLPNGTFTSSYTNYRIHVVITAVTSDADFSIRMRVGGSDNSTASYERAGIQFDSSTSTLTALNAANQTSFDVAEQDAGIIRYRLALDIMTPELTQPTVIYGNVSYVNKPASATFFRLVNGVFTGATSFDSLSFISSVASSITGSYRVYGYATS